ncbi:hypothetical protein Snov_0040 [Ancylobacter novellus DSM 506]|uniref:Methyltransferase type 11 domain-containing protein n=2 Tax=Ancylobacter novellus TaxID=921 RepID=D6ZZW3_ANCN5|nr:hypothetical protein Snov_0040 [Ancylobacter novellus DSM 506]
MLNPKYDQQVQSQIGQYSTVENMHNAAAAANWFNSRFLRPRMRQVSGTESVAEFYAVHIAEAVARTGLDVAVSLGAGYGSLEIDIINLARSRGLPAFHLKCFELSPVLVDRANRAIREQGLEDFVSAQVVDLNVDLPLAGNVAAFMAHHSLHHLVELERIFDQVNSYLPPEGAFITMDMIGRNGHMRWPETLGIIRELWPALPDRLKWDHQLSRFDRWFENWDCSIEGFEGIRSQDILPALLERFKFERFLAYGGLSEIFTDRSFGPNFDPNNPPDANFLSQIKALEDDLIRAEQVKPTQLIAVMRPLRSHDCPGEAICFEGLTPTKAVRSADRQDFGAPHLGNTSFVSPFPAPDEEPAIPMVACGAPIHFVPGGNGAALTRWGWAEPDPDFTWSVGLASALRFRAAEGAAGILLKFVDVRPPTTERRFLTLRLNDREVASIELDGIEAVREISAAFPDSLSPGDEALLEIELTRPLRPDVDDSVDRRPLGIGLISMSLAPA